MYILYIYACVVSSCCEIMELAGQVKEEKGSVLVME
jgi:hypothetical protein